MVQTGVVGRGRRSRPRVRPDAHFPLMLAKYACSLARVCQCQFCDGWGGGCESGERGRPVGIFSSFILVVRGGVGSGGSAHLPHGARDEAEAQADGNLGADVNLSGCDGRGERESRSVGRLRSARKRGRKSPPPRIRKSADGRVCRKAPGGRGSDAPAGSNASSGQPRTLTVAEVLNGSHDACSSACTCSTVAAAVRLFSPVFQRARDHFSRLLDERHEQILKQMDFYCSAPCAFACAMTAFTTSLISPGTSALACRNIPSAASGLPISL